MCPLFSLMNAASASGARQAHLEYYFTANGEELRAEVKRNFRGVFESG